jgi:hypothetical protein
MRRLPFIVAYIPPISSMNRLQSRFVVAELTQLEEPFGVVRLPTPDKRPFLLVDGLISNPSEFQGLHNARKNDPSVRRRQVWFFYYPTSLPVVQFQARP